MRRRKLAAAVAGIVLVGGGGVAYAAAQGASGSYRTAVVTVGDVDETLSLSGTITASARRDLSFGASGTVKKVAVAAGDTVEASDVLGQLDPTDLETAVTKAEETLAKAKAQLETDQASQASTVSDGATTTPTPSSSSSEDTSKDTSKGSGDSSSTSTKALKKALAKLATQQTAVTSAQAAATDAIASAKTALAAQTTACKDAEVTESTTDSDFDSDSDSDAEGDGGSTTTTTTTTVSLSDECTTALAAVQDAQDVVATKQDTLQTALQDLTATLTAAVKTLRDASTSSGSGSGSTAAPAESGSSGSSSGSAASGSGGGGTVTAASLAKDQAEIDTADAELTEAKRALTSAQLTAPYDGEILSVSAAKGDTVGESDVVIVIKGDGTTTATTTVTLDQVPDVEVGQTATVTPAGAAEPVTGTVSSIGLLPDSSSDTSTYPVTIDLDGEVAAPEGSTASIQLVVGTAADVLTVPSSAVSTTGRSSVTLLIDGQPVVTPVAVGVVGSTRTAITDGVKEGQEVVLADLGASLPSGDSTTTSLTGGGGFGGGMRPGGPGGPG